jgi:hypothetical protein
MHSPSKATEDDSAVSVEERKARQAARQAYLQELLLEQIKLVGEMTSLCQRLEGCPPGAQTDLVAECDQVKLKHEDVRGMIAYYKARLLGTPPASPEGSDTESESPTELSVVSTASESATENTIPPNDPSGPKCPSFRGGQ